MAYILGLTGSLGSGKSTVSSMFRSLGVPTICADELAREVTARQHPALQEIVEAFGPGILTDSGELDRAALAAIVFRDPEARARLESIVHPRVRERELELLHENRHAPVVVLDIPLLYETGAESLCNGVAVVAVDDAERFRRLQASRSMTRDQIEARLAAQMPQAEKRRRADFTIDNSGTIADTEKQVRQLLRTLSEGSSR